MIKNIPLFKGSRTSVGVYCVCETEEPSHGQDPLIIQRVRGGSQFSGLFEQCGKNSHLPILIQRKNVFIPFLDENQI